MKPIEDFPGDHLDHREVAEVFHCAAVQSAGQGCRLKALTIKDEFNRSGPVLHLLLRYTQALITQMAQTAVCNRHHSLDQQLCRWLLLSMDRLH